MIGNETNAAARFAARCAESSCRVCGGGPMRPVLDLGMMPLTSAFRASRDETQPRFPLEVAFCDTCSLVQVLEQVPAEAMFNDEYPYFSSFSDALLRHSREHAYELIETLRLNGRSLVVEPASNDGYLLRWFAERGVRVLGIEPCSGPAREAKRLGIETLVEFFTSALGGRLRSQGRFADVVLANNVLAHVADQNDFVRGIERILCEGGVAEIEFPYVRALIDKCEFDTIYHEHLCYFSLHAVDALFRRNGLVLNDVREIAIHGGSLRVRASRGPERSERLMRMLADEQLLGINRHEYYAAFAERVAALRMRLRSMLEDLAENGHTIACYGAAAKGAILLNYLDLPSDFFEFVVDRNVHKQGRWLPGLDLQVLATDELVRRMPDYTLILPWNFSDEIIEQQREYRGRGGKFIVPIPEPALVE